MTFIYIPTTISYLFEYKDQLFKKMILYLLRAAPRFLCPWNPSLTGTIRNNYLSPQEIPCFLQSHIWIVLSRNFLETLTTDKWIRIFQGRRTRSTGATPRGRYDCGVGVCRASYFGVSTMRTGNMGHVSSQSYFRSPVAAVYTHCSKMKGVISYGTSMVFLNRRKEKYINQTLFIWNKNWKIFRASQRLLWVA